MKRAHPLLSTLIGATLALTTGCEPAAQGASSPGAPARWSLGDEPTLHVGVLEGEDPYQLYDVRDARRLPDGRVAVVNQGTREVRLYGPDGTFLRAFGEDGDGPGQWRAIASVHPAGGDTLLVVDHRLGRHGLVDLETGRYIGTAEAGRAERLVPRVWHHRGLILQTPPDVYEPGVFVAVVEALSVGSADAPTFLQLDTAGRVWVSGAPAAAAPLRVYDLDGRQRATLPLPARFRPTHLGVGEVVGVWRDSLDVEHVRAYPVEGAQPWRGPSIEEVLRRGADMPGPTGTDLPGFAEGFRAVATSQEIHYASMGSYTTDLDRLNEVRAIDLPEGARADIIDAGPTGWRGRLVDTSSGAGCILLYGAYGPIEGLDPGRISCWNPSTP